MSNRQATQGVDRTTIYQIRLKEHLRAEWAVWFDGLTITHEDNGETLLSGPALDQAALHGVLKKVRDLGLVLISVVPDEKDSVHA